MKDLNIVIDCQNKEQTLDVIDTFKNMGYEQYESIDGSLIVRVMEGYVFDMDWEPKDYDERLDYEAFKHKFKSNKMIELINKAKSDLKMNDSELSLALGKSRQYIGKMLSLPQSKKVQDRVIKEINALFAREKFSQLSISDHTHIGVENAEIKNVEIVITGTIQDPKDKQISELKKANEQQKLVIDKLDDQLLKAEKIHNEDVKAIDFKDKKIKEINDSRFNINLELVENKNLVDELTDALQWEQKEFDKTRDELNDLKSSHTTSKALNWFFVVAIILAVIVWKAYNG